MEYLEHLRRAIEELPIVYQHSILHISITIGASEAKEGASVTDLVLEADRALYLGKDRGRNQVVACDFNG